MLTKYQIEQIMKSLPTDGDTAVEIRDEVLYTVVNGKTTRHGKVADKEEAAQTIDVFFKERGTHTRHEVNVVELDGSTFKGMKEIVDVVNHLLNSPALREIPAGYPPHLAAALRDGEKRMGIPALLLEQMANAAAKGGCNCGYCLVNKMYHDARARRASDNPVEALKIAAIEFIAMTRGPQAGALCDDARKSLRREAAEQEERAADPFAGFDVLPN